MREQVIAVLLLQIALGVTARAAPAEREDAVLNSGHRSGAQRVASVRDGAVRVEYFYTDRDHGDHIEASWTLDAAGIPISYAAGGHDYLHAPVKERFEIRDGVARWSNAQGQGAGERDQRAFYMPSNPVPEYQGVLARALLSASGRSLPLFPSGTASIQLAGSLSVQRDGKLIEWRQYRISGLDFMPQAVWLDQDGNTAAVMGQFVSTICCGQDELAPTLLQAEDEFARSWHAQVAARVTRTPNGELIVRNARLFDPRDLSVSAGMSVVVRGDRIVRVARDADVTAAAGAEVMDAGARFLMPGLWDVHAHLAGVDGLLNIANGVTSVRDLANDLDIFLKRVARFDAGTEVGPRVLKAGFIDAEGPYAGPLPVRVKSLDEALRWVDWYADHGYVQIKTYMSIQPAWVAPLAARARERGLRYSGHVPANMSAAQFIEAGADEIQHFNYVELNFLFPRVRETTRMQNRFIEPAVHAVEITPDRREVRDFIDLLQRRKVVLDPTMSLLEERLASRPDQVRPGAEMLAGRAPLNVQRSLLGRPYDAPAGRQAAYSQAIPSMLRLVKALHVAGIRILPGTDMLAGYTLHHELELYARAGIPTGEVLKLATLTPAQVMGVDDRLGFIAAGMLADMVLIDGDPLQNISDVRNVDVVIKGGRLYASAEIEAALGLAPRH